MNLGKITAATLAAGAVVVPLAHAEGTPGTQGFTKHNRWPYASAQVAPTHESTVGKYGPIDRWPYEAAGSVTVVGSASGFDWSDAGVGAASATGLVLVAGGTAMTLRRRRLLAH